MIHVCRTGLNGLFDDLWELDTRIMQWTLLDALAGVSVSQPEARDMHSMVVIGSSFYILGGRGATVPPPPSGSSFYILGGRGATVREWG